MSKEVLQITISKRKTSKYKVIRWFQYKWFVVWRIWRPKVLSKVCWFLSEMILKMMPQKEREKLLKEFEEIEIHIVNNIK